MLMLWRLPWMIAAYDVQHRIRTQHFNVMLLTQLHLITCAHPPVCMYLLVLTSRCLLSMLHTLLFSIEL